VEIRKINHTYEPRISCVLDYVDQRMFWILMLHGLH